MDWTNEMDKALKQGLKEGLSAALIAEKIGGVTRNAVLGRAYRQNYFFPFKPKKQKERGPYITRKNPGRIRPEDVVDYILDLKDAGLTWHQIADKVGISYSAARSWAIQYGGYDTEAIRYFTDEDENYIVQAWKDHVPVENIADKLDRSFGVIRQKIFQLQREGRMASRDQYKVRLLKQYGEQALEAGATPKEALHNITEAKKLAFANALNEARKARTAFKEQALQDMNDDIAGGVDRNRAIFIARSKGVGLQQIAEVFNLTRERARQICISEATNIVLEKLTGKKNGPANGKG